MAFTSFDIKRIASWHITQYRKILLGVMSRMYVCFAITPLMRNISRALHKPVKVYFYDNADIVETSTNQGAIFENLIATTLLKRLHFLEDYYGYRCQLHYIRDKEGREVDFVTCIDEQVEDLIEVKSSDTAITSALKYYQKKLNPKRTIQVVRNLRQPYEKDNILVTNPIALFQAPPWIF